MGSGASNPYVTQEGLKRLANHKYSSTELSYIANYILHPYCFNRIVEWVPTWVAPNVLTLSGLFCILIPCLVLHSYCPVLAGEAPGWVYVLCGVGIFAYMTLDNIDGKQARRTRSGSALGQLFDHGVDGIVVSLMQVIIVTMLQLGISKFSFWTLFMGYYGFFGATWEEFHTHHMTFGVVNGPCEGILLVVFLCFLTAFTGADMWTWDYMDVLPWKIFGRLPPMSLNVLMFYLTLIFLVITIFTNFRNTYQKLATRGEFITAVTQWLPIEILNIAAAVVWTYSWESVMKFPLVFVLTFGLLFAYINSTLILKHVAAEEFPILSHHFIPILVVAGNSYLNASGYHLFDPTAALLVLFLYVLGAYFHFAFTVTNTIATFLVYRAVRRSARVRFRRFLYLCLFIFVLLLRRVLMACSSSSTTEGSP